MISQRSGPTPVLAPQLNVIVQMSQLGLIGRQAGRTVMTLGVYSDTELDELLFEQLCF